MSITTERGTLLTEFFNSDEDRARKLWELEPEVAVEQINAQGYDFTVAELLAYGELVKNAAGELEDGALEGIAGGYVSADSIAGDTLPASMIIYGIFPSPLTVPGILANSPWFRNR